MIIELRKYIKEAKHIFLAAEPFIVAKSVSVLKEIQTDLDTGLNSRKAFRWGTKRPMKLKPAENYDRRIGAVTSVNIEISFLGCFSPPPNKKNDWTIDQLETHLKVFGKDEDNPALHLHIDKKNDTQRGPHVHVQVAEECTERLGMSKHPSWAAVGSESPL
jgi:hypothetical protein